MRPAAPLTPMGASFSADQVSEPTVYIGHLGSFHPGDYPFVQLELFHLFKSFTSTFTRRSYLVVVANIQN